MRLLSAHEKLELPVSSRRRGSSEARRWSWRERIFAVVSVLAVLAIANLLLVSNSLEDALSAICWAPRSYWRHSTGRAGDLYLLGVGKADITGPVVEINMMGYADPSQVGTGLRQRLYARAFIVGDVAHPEDRLVYLVLDTQSGDTAVRYGILEGLEELGHDYSVYGQQNVAVTGTHSHAGPGAWLNYLLPQITSKGFDQQSYRAIVDGAVLAIRRAHESLAPGYLMAGSTKVVGANINRSLYAYLANPEAERARYNVSEEDDGSVEKELTLLRFQHFNGTNLGVLTWFPTHGTSMLGNNTLIAGDNKGVAAYLFEKSVEDDMFVAGFSQASVGDTSPNVLGAWCEDGSGQMCSFENSTCASNGKSQFCHARGPFFRVKDNGATSCFEIGRRQFEPARKLLDELDHVGTPIRGPSVKSFHTYHDMVNFTFPLANGTYVQTCAAALGYSFAAGTSDGPGAFDFTQNNPDDPKASPVWRVVRGFVKEPSAAQSACHAPKPILLDVGEIETPYPWAPNVVDVQVLRVGQFVSIISPGEATTMAGRRWKEAVKASAMAMSLSGRRAREPIVVLGGPANSYTHYITTTEEYGIQRYEGASTLYGPYTLDAYINVTLTHLPHLHAASRTHPPSGPQPPNNANNSLSFISPVVRDGTPLFKKFGAVLNDVSSSALPPGAVVSATFVGANPRNDLRLERTYAAVDRFDPVKGDWVRVRDDADWDLTFAWARTSRALGTSTATVSWDTSGNASAYGPAPPGAYRLRYFGDARSLGGTVTAFEGMSSVFELRG